MGVKGLFNILKPILTKKHLNEFKGKRVAIDGLAWIYRGFYGMIYEKIPQIEKTLFFISKMISMFKYLDIEVIFVLDGRTLEAKDFTKNLRNEKRFYYDKKKDKYGNDSYEKQKFKDLSNKIDSNVINIVIEFLKSSDIKYIIAPYEADAQMVYLQKINLVDYLVSEDSDLILYGGNNIIFKLNNFGECEFLDLNKKLDQKILNKNKLLSNFLNFTQEEKIITSLFCGCDYTKGIKGIGITTSINFVIKYKNKKILNTINKKYDFDLKHFELCDNIFKKQLVYNPINKIMQRFDNSDESLYKKGKGIYKYIGEYINNGEDFSKGIINILTLKNKKKVNIEFNIEKFTEKLNDPKFISKIKNALSNGQFSIERENEINKVNKDLNSSKNKETADFESISNFNSIMMFNNNSAIDNSCLKYFSEKSTPSDVSKFDEKQSGIKNLNSIKHFKINLFN